MNREDFDKCIASVIDGGYCKSDFKFETRMIDWKSVVDESKLRKRMATCQVKSDMHSFKEMVDGIVPDVIQYLSPHFKPLIRAHVC